MCKFKKIISTILLTCMLMSFGTATISASPLWDIVTDIDNAVKEIATVEKACEVYAIAAWDYIFHGNPYRRYTKDYVDYACKVLGNKPF